MSKSLVARGRHRVRADDEGPEQVGRYPNTWLDRSAFTETTAGTLGNIGVVRGPRWKTFDFSIQKYFPIGEKRKLEFRTEVFNLTNTPQFGSPNRSASSATFGEITSAQGERNIQFAPKFSF